MIRKILQIGTVKETNHYWEPIIHHDLVLDIGVNWPFADDSDENRSTEGLDYPIFKGITFSSYLDTIEETKSTIVEEED